MQTLFSRTITDILAARLRVSALNQGQKVVIADFIIATAENVNPRFDRTQFLKLAGMFDESADTQYRS